MTFLHYYHLNFNDLSSYLLIKSPDKSIIWGVILLIMWNLKLIFGIPTFLHMGAGTFWAALHLLYHSSLFPQNKCQICHHFFEDSLFHDPPDSLIFVYSPYDYLIGKIVSGLLWNPWGRLWRKGHLLNCHSSALLALSQVLLWGIWWVSRFLPIPV